MKALDIEQYRALVESAPTMIWRAGVDAKCDYFNATWLAFTGRTLDQELGSGWVDGVHPDDRDACLALYGDHFERRQPFEMEYRLRRHDGAYRYISDCGAPYFDAAGAFSGFIGSCIDVDDRRIREAISESAEFFELSLDNLCVAGFDGYIKRINPSWTRTLGWTAEELMSRPSIEFVHPDDRAMTLAARGRLETLEPLFALVNRYRCKDGTYRWFEWRSVTHPEQGLVYAAARDVTEQKNAQRVLRELTESLEATLNSMADGVVATDANSAVSHMNPMAEKLTGWAANEAKGRALAEVFHVVDASTRDAVAPPVERTLREGIAVEREHHTLLIGRDGREVPVATSSAPMRGPDGTLDGAVLVFRDMTAEKEAASVKERLQRQLILADRMASVGTLAAGVAHEINNPLAYVMSNLEMLLEEIRGLDAAPAAGQLSEWAEMAVEARHGTERIRKIVRGLRTFSRAEEERRAVIDVVPVIELAVDMAFNEIRHRARLVKDFGPIPPVFSDDARLGQVFINLLVNAAHALPEGGTEANEVRVVTSTDAMGRAVIEVRDTGLGLPPGVIDRVFEPFFTTKPIGIGTGLGLFICHSIVTGMGGEITASNRDGRGAVFRVTLPPAVAHVDEPSAAVAPVKPPTKRAAVLIVDDEAAVGVTLGRVLRDHEVTVVTTAKDALALVLADKPFDVILSDLMMPEMSGMDLYDELSRRRPQAAERMVFVTGGAFTQAASAFLDRVPNERILKPFDATTVRTIVQRFAK